MQRITPWLALLLAGFAVPTLQADPGYPYPYYPTPQTPPGWPPYRACICPAPDACGPGYYCQGMCGAVYGPNYCLRPCWEPFNGFTPCLAGPCGPGVGPGGGLTCPQAQHAIPGIPPPPHYGFEPPRPRLYIPPPPPVVTQNPPPSPVFPTHPYAHGPRDYFMQE